MRVVSPIPGSSPALLRPYNPNSLYAYFGSPPNQTGPCMLLYCAPGISTIPAKQGALSCCVYRPNKRKNERVGKKGREGVVLPPDGRTFHCFQHFLICSHAHPSKVNEDAQGPFMSRTLNSTKAALCPWGLR